MGKTEIAIAATNNNIGGLDKPQERRKDIAIKLISNLAQTADGNEKMLPPNVNFLSNQVAGHMYDGKSIGMLKQTDGTVLKPMKNDMCGEREMRFYEELQQTKDPELLELKKFVANYYGTKELQFNGKEVPCIALEDLTEEYKEPCVIDIKIGRRTWDPLASYEKITNEDRKYLECKRDLGFCITGFQVFKATDGRLCKYGKDYGKVLNKETVKDALKLFLNADSGLNRKLLIQLLVPLWRIQHWFRSQRRICLYSSSLLLVYDARRLRQYVQHSVPTPVTPISPSPIQLQGRVNRPISFAFTLKDEDQARRVGFSGQLTDDGPVLKSPTSPTRSKDGSFSPPSPSSSDSTWQRCLKKLQRTHSFSNNYDNDLQDFRQEYEAILNDLVCSNSSKEVWATVKMIDFAHVFPSENNTIDHNYLEGIENLVKILEGFLEETN